MNYQFIIARDPAARLDLAEAYTRLFTGHGSVEDAQVVLTDLMSFSGFFSVCPENEDVNRHEGKRTVGGRVFSMVNMPDAERDALFRAARQSSLADQLNGNI